MFTKSTTVSYILSFFTFLQLAVEYEGNALFVKVDTDDEYEFARDMQVTIVSYQQKKPKKMAPNVIIIFF